MSRRVNQAQVDLLIAKSEGYRKAFEHSARVVGTFDRPDRSDAEKELLDRLQRRFRLAASLEKESEDGLRQDAASWLKAHGLGPDDFGTKDLWL